MTEHQYRENFSNPMVLRPSFDPTKASLDELETYLAELGLVERALKSHFVRLQDANDASNTEQEVDDTADLLRTLKNHRGALAISLDQDYWHENDEPTHWVPRADH